MSFAWSQTRGGEKNDIWYSKVSDWKILFLVWIMFPVVFLVMNEPILSGRQNFYFEMDFYLTGICSDVSLCGEYLTFWWISFDVTNSTLVFVLKFDVVLTWALSLQQSNFLIYFHLYGFPCFAAYFTSSLYIVSILYPVIPLFHFHLHTLAGPTTQPVQFCGQL